MQVLKTCLSALLLLAPPAMGAVGPGETPRSSAEGPATPSSADHGASGSAAVGFSDDERAALRAAERRSCGLEELRGGDISLSNSDLQLILLTVLVVILLIIIF